MKRLPAAILVIPLLGSLGLVVITGRFAWLAITTPVTGACPKEDLTPVWGVWVVVASSLFFLGGGLLTHARHRPELDMEIEKRQSRLTRAVVPVFLGVVALLLGYETFAFGQSRSYNPITWYVRCTNLLPGLAPFASAGAAMAVSFLAGQWFWHLPVPQTMLRLLKGLAR